MFITYIFIIGLVVGSFLNVLIDRWSFDKSILGRSHCDNCHKQILNKDLIPLLSFLILKGKCRFCNAKLSWYYPFIELLTAVIFVINFIYFPYLSILEKVFSFGIISCLIVIFFADIKYQIISDNTLLLLLFFSLPFVDSQYSNFFSGIFIFFLLYLIYFFSKKRGLGFGDVKFGFVIGFLQGFYLGFLSIYFSFLIGGLYGLMLVIFKKKKMKSKIAFGPFMIFGVIITTVFKTETLNILSRLFGY